MNWRKNLVFRPLPPSYSVIEDTFPYVLNEDTLVVHILKLDTHGSSILVQNQTTNILLDIGDEVGTDYVISYLGSLGVEEIDLLVLTHPHGDHIGRPDGFQKFLAQFTINELWAIGHPVPTWYDGATPTPSPSETNTPYITALLDTVFPDGWNVAGQGASPGIIGTPIIPYHEPTADNEETVYTRGKVELHVLNPPSILTWKNPNNDSIVIKLVWGNMSVMLSADLSQSGETRILSALGSKVVKSDILYLGHHGINDATSQAWLDAVSPRVAVVQAVSNVSPRIQDMLVTKNIPLKHPFKQRKDIIFALSKEKLLNEQLTTQWRRSIRFTKAQQ